MSVINQLLVDLEKRRASGAERSLLPNHVRALPNEQSPLQWGWIAAGGAAVVAALAVTWMLASGPGGAAEPAAAAQPPRPIADVAIERVVAASAGVVMEARADDAPRDAPASRLSFELSSLPAAPPEPAPAARPSLSSARVIGRDTPDAPPLDSSAIPATRAADAKPSSVSGAAKSPPGTSTTKPEIRKEMHQPSPRELAEIEYRKASTLLHQSRLGEAQEGFQSALAAYPAHHGARQGLVGALLESRKYADAERVLNEGLALAPGQLGFVMTLARLQLDRGDGAQGIVTLKKGLEHAQGNADYFAFLAALLQRQGRHEEAIEQFQTALRMKPATGVWWLGLGVSLQAAHRGADAHDAYSRARSTNNLSPELAAFADQRLKQLK